MSEDHALSDDCTCGPTTLPVKREDGSVGWVTVHNRFDGGEVAVTCLVQEWEPISRPGINGDPS